MRACTFATWKAGDESEFLAMFTMTRQNSMLEMPQATPKSPIAHHQSP
jgi:hypothetical protein